MNAARIAKAVGLGSLSAAAASVVAERLVLQKVADTLPPTGWTEPTWPPGTKIMVPTNDGAELLVELTGHGGLPTVVLVHGLSGNHHNWGPVAARLVADGYRVVGINQRGHGGSTIGTEGFGPARQGTDVGQVLAALDLDDVTLVGHSMGGVAAMSLATLRPQAGWNRVRALVLVATLADTVAKDREISLKLGTRSWYQTLSRHPKHSNFLARFIFGNTPSQAELDAIVTAGKACPEESRIGATLGLLGYDIGGLLPSIEVPTTVICGTRDLLTKHGENQAIAEAIPGATFISVPDGGHMVIWENSEQIADAIAARTPAPNIASR